MLVFLLFLKILKISLTASIAIAFVLLVRLLLKRAPKIFSYMLWTVVLFRLLCPISFEIPIGVVPDFEHVTSSKIETVIPLADFQTSSVITEVKFADMESLDAPVPVSSTVTGGVVIAFIWLAGVAAMLTYGLISYLRLKRDLIGAGRICDNIFIADHIAAPFTLGIISPVIYLPSSLTEKERSYIILHEQIHIRRCDNIVKIIAFMALAIHWFNPIIWLSFALAAEDMEMSCDEAVMKKLSNDIRSEYSASLLSFAIGRRVFAGAPLSFGEGNPKWRIKNVMNYKKPALHVTIIALMAFVVAAVCLLTKPVDNTADVKTIQTNNTMRHEEVFNTDKLSNSDRMLIMLTESQQVVPYSNLLWAEEWTGTDFSTFNGESAYRLLPLIKDDIPAFSMNSSIRIACKDYCGIIGDGVSIYNENYVPIAEKRDLSVLYELEDGQYYVIIQALETGKYIESKDKNERYCREYILRLNLAGNAGTAIHKEPGSGVYACIRTDSEEYPFVYYLPDNQETWLSSCEEVFSMAVDGKWAKNEYLNGTYVKYKGNTWHLSDHSRLICIGGQIVEKENANPVETMLKNSVPYLLVN